MLKKLVHAGARRSFQEASKDLHVLAEADISAHRVRRWTEAIGNERAALRSEAASTYESLPLPARRECPAGIAAPPVACVQMDGGRLQVRERVPSVAPPEHCEQQTAPDPFGEERQTCKDEADTDDQRKGKFWKESKVGCLLTMSSQVSTVDPCPTIPKIFVDPSRIKRICSEIKGNSSPATERRQAPEPNAESVEKLHQEPDESEPKVTSRSVIASRHSSQVFGALLAAAAFALGLNAAVRKAFVCDGQSANWKVWEKWFSTYTPIVDFVHAVCYVYACAMAGVPVENGWATYLEWAQWLWSGELDKLIAAVSAKQELLGTPEAKESKTTPRSIVAECLTYLRNQKERMNYPEYRKQGLPTSSVYIESSIKQINRRVKSTDKFWDRAAEAILNVAADTLCPDAELDQFWDTRPSRIACNRQWHTNEQTAT